MDWDEDHLRGRILGSLVATALGDAIGADVEQCAAHEIAERHGGALRELGTLEPDGSALGNGAGEVTDDTSQLLLLADALVEGEGELDAARWLAALRDWARTSPLARFMGPTTRAALVPDGRDATPEGAPPDPRIGATNGAAMRAAPAGLVRPGDIEGAVRLAWTSARVTHDTQVAAAGAGAMAAGVARALVPGAEVLAVAQACLEGARLGEELGAREGRRVPGPNVARRVEMALVEAVVTTDLEDAIGRIEATVGNSVMVFESVPAAIGLFVAAGGHPYRSVIAGVNIGNDTDTIAAMAGALGGALRGLDDLPARTPERLSAANDMDLVGTAERRSAVGRWPWARS